MFDRFRDGVVVDVAALGDGEGTALQGPVEDAVLELITGRGVRGSQGLERAA